VHLTLLTGIAYQSIIYYAEAAHDRYTPKQRNTHKKDSKNENSTLYHIDNLLLFCLFSLRDNIWACSAELAVPKVCHVGPTIV